MSKEEYNIKMTVEHKARQIIIEQNIGSLWSQMQVFQEEYFKEALIQLGWTPPKLSEYSTVATKEKT